MRTTLPRHRGVLALIAPVLIALVLALGLGSWTAPPAQAYSVAIPTGLKATASTTTSLTLSWSAARGASGYRIQYSASPSLTSPKYVSTTRTSATLTGLAPATTYWFRVAAAANGGTGAKQSDYTQTPFPSARTRYPSPVPTGLTAASATSTSLDLRWNAVSGAKAYRVMYSSSSTLAGARYAGSTTNGVKLTGLAAGTTYHLRVAVVSPTTGAKLSDYTAAPYPTGRTSAGSTAPYDLKVATFNIRSASLDDDRHPTQKWAYRRAAVTSTITTRRPDVIGLQEATQASSYIAGGLTQYTDLRNALHKAGARYEVTNTAAYNCEAERNPNNCVYRDRGASQGTRIMYNTDTMALMSQGSVKLRTQVPGQPTRYLTWAKLKIRTTGDQVFAVNVHIDAAGTPAQEQAQWQQVLDETLARRGGLPVVATGDFNSHRWTQPAGTMLARMSSAGFGDVLNQKYDAEPTGIRAEKVTNGFFHSWNGFQRDLDGAGRCFCTRTSRIGSMVDYVFVTNSLRVKSWEQLVSYDSSYNRTGTIPSDHNMIQVTVVVP